MRTERPGTKQEPEQAEDPDSGAPSLLNSLFGHPSVGAAEIDLRAGRVLRMSPRLQERLGYGPEDQRARQLTLLAGPDPEAAGAGADVETGGMTRLKTADDGFLAAWFVRLGLSAGGGGAPRALLLIIELPADAAAAGAYREIYENVTEGIYRSSLDGRQLSANPALVRLNGYTSEAELLAAVADIGSEWYVDPLRRAQFAAAMAAHGRVEDFVSEVYRHKTRERIWISENARLVRDAGTGAPLYYEGSIRDVTAAMRGREIEERLRKLAASFPGWLFQFRWMPGERGAFPYASDGLARLTGLAPEAVAADPAPLLARVHPADRAGLIRSVLLSARRGADWGREFRLEGPGGRELWVRGDATPEAQVGGAILWHGCLIDVSRRKAAEQRLQDLAFFDPLTGLPNRRLLVERLRAALDAVRHGAGLGALLFVDLDNFKLLNDTSGHDVGDLLLIQVARRLESCVREHDTVARLGGDEFVVLLRHLGADPAGAARQAQSVGERILSVLPQPCFLRERMFQATPSIGIVLFDGRDGGVESLLQRADIAMYQAKAEGRNGLRFFDPSMQARLGARLALIGDLRAACERHEFTLDLEPQGNLAGRHAGAEAKLAWRRAETGPVRPEIFLPLAEETGLSLPLSQWAMRRLFVLARELAGSGEHRGLDLALDLSPRRFHAPDLVREVEALLAETGAPAERLLFEISEQVTIEDPDAVAARMRALKRLGLRFVLDGFGTGFSSFARLRRLPIDRIKIDPTFVAEVDQSEPARLLVRAVVALARGLGVAVIADGVAREGQLRILAEEGCNLFQGKLLGPFGLPVRRPAGFSECPAALEGAPGVVATPLFG